MDLSEILHNNKPTKTREGLPILTEKTRVAFVESLQVESEIRAASNSILKEWAKETERENPEIMKYIRRIIGEYPPNLQRATLACLLSIYQILKSQALNDRIEEYFGIQDRNYHT